MPTTATRTRAESTTQPRNRSFVNNRRAFKRIYKASRSAWNEGTSPLDAYFEARNGVLGEEYSLVGSMFGVEVEFDLRSGYSIDGVASALHDNNLTPYPHRNGYHAGYNSTREWRYEYDATVSGGEVISPILRDTQASWLQLLTALDTIADNGGTATGLNAGGHISIDVSTLEAEDFTRLQRLASVFEDVMFRLATNPHRAVERTPENRRRRLSTHRRRGNPYCPSMISADLNNVYEMTRSTWLNHDSGRRRLEFRVFDGNLDPAIVQTNIMIAHAFVRAATKSTLLDDLADAPIRRVGWHRQQEWRTQHDTNRPRLTGADWDADTEAIRQFVDLLFDNTQDKERVITLFAMNDWSFGRGIRRRNRW